MFTIIPKSFDFQNNFMILVPDGSPDNFEVISLSNPMDGDITQQPWPGSFKHWLHKMCSFNALVNNPNPGKSRMCFLGAVFLGDLSLFGNQFKESVPLTLRGEYSEERTKNGRYIGSVGRKKGFIARSLENKQKRSNSKI